MADRSDSNGRAFGRQGYLVRAHGGTVPYTGESRVRQEAGFGVGFRNHRSRSEVGGSSVSAVTYSAKRREPLDEASPAHLTD